MFASNNVELMLKLKSNYDSLAFIVKINYEIVDLSVPANTWGKVVDLISVPPIYGVKSLI